MRPSLLGPALTLAFLAATTAGCMAEKKAGASDLRIYNGEAVTSSSDATMRSTVVLLRGGDQPFCTGILVDKALVVSAAHCFAGQESELASVGFSIGFGAGPSYDAVLPVKSLYYHGEYGMAKIGEKAEVKMKAQNPTGYARLETLVEKEKAGGTLSDSETTEKNDLTQELLAIFIPIASDPGFPIHDVAIMLFDGTPPSYAKDVDIASEASDGAPVLAAGYGLTGTDPGGQAGILYKVALAIDGASAGAQEFFAQGSFNQGTCKGDSGGPAYLEENGKLVAFGVVSRGTAGYPACGGDRTVYTDLIDHRDWIVCHAQRLSGSEQNCGGIAAGKKLELPGSGGGGGGGGSGTCLDNQEALALLLCALAEGNGSLGPAEQIQCNALAQRFQQHGECNP